MKIVGKCERCKEHKLFIRKRTYNVVGVGKITSKDELCNRCFKIIGKMIKKDGKEAK